MLGFILTIIIICYTIQCYFGSGREMPENNKSYFLGAKIYQANILSV